MSQSKLNDLAGKFGKGGPPGLLTGLKVLAGVGAAIYGATQSVYTGKRQFLVYCTIFLSISSFHKKFRLGFN